MGDPCGAGKLKILYDSFVAKYGRINSRTNVSAFSADNAYYLLSSLEVAGQRGKFSLRKQICSLAPIHIRKE